MAITVTHSKVSTIPDGDDSSLIRPSDWNDDHVLTGTIPVANGGTGASTLTGYVKGNGTSAMTAATTIPNTDITGLGTMSTQNANNVAITGGSISGATVSGYIPTTEKAQPLGVATLDAGGKVPTSQIPLQGDLNYQGTWNATTNTPTLTSGTGTKGYYYVVDVAGTTNLDGITDWQIGDWAIFNGTVWQKVDNTDAVTSVNGLVGTVVLTTTNIAEGTNEYFTTARARTSVSAGTGISYDNSTGVITNSSPSLGGDVVGPASATDNAIARFDTTTGKLIQNSVVTVSDAGQIAGATSILNTNYVDFDTTYATTLTEGQLGWDGNNTLGLGMAGGNVIQRIGEDTYIYVKASASITKGQLVMFTGVVGASSVVTAAPSTGVTNGQYIIGLAADSISNNAFGLIQVTGSLKGFDTSAFIDGDILYYDSANTGGLTKTYPTSGPIVTVCAVTNAGSGGSGSVQIRVSVTQRLTASTGIFVSQSGGTATITNTAPDQVVSIAGGTGISTSGTYPSFTVTNTAPDQTVAITAGTGISVSGTYPNFTVTNTEPSSGGTVTSVSGTAPIASSGGNTPAISISQATTSTDGYLSSTDWNTFNNKQPAGSYLTSVTADAPLSGSGTSGSHLVISQANTSTNGYLSSTDWNTFNGKAPSVTYTTNYVPYGQGTTTPALSSNFQYDPSLKNLIAPQIRASNGIIVNSKTVAADFTIASGDSAMSTGPITVASGITVTVSSGSKWVVL